MTDGHVHRWVRVENACGVFLCSCGKRAIQTREGFVVQRAKRKKENG